MAYLGHHLPYPMRPSNKEPQWASVYDDLFNQYIDTDGFEIGNCELTASGSDEASNAAAGTNEPLTDSTESGSPDVRRSSDDEFWARTLKALEDSAAAVDETEQRERQTPLSHSTKQHHHADFLSLGGYPSPHISSSPTSPSEAARRRKASRSRIEHSGRTPERPVRINKTHRSSSKSPRMMTPSRYRASFRDTWAERMRNTPQMVTMNLPVRVLPLSPPPSSKMRQEFCSPRDFEAVSHHGFSHMEEQFSPFSNNFPQAVHMPMHTPSASPLTTPGVERGAVFSDVNYDALHTINGYYESKAQQRASWNSFDTEDDYEPGPSISPWIAGERAGQRPHAAAPDTSVFLTSGFHDNQELARSGLMISYDPTLAPARTAQEMDAMDPAGTYNEVYHTYTEAQSLQERSQSPSPRRRHSRTNSRGRSRKPSGPRKASGGAFVNYTPGDSEKLLTGVAPSGSSKTKARREKEAEEKRRRFSQAAVRAVAEAGGNVTALKDVLI